MLAACSIRHSLGFVESKTAENCSKNLICLTAHIILIKKKDMPQIYVYF